MSVNQHKAPPGAKPWLFVTANDTLYAFPLASVAEVSRPAFKTTGDLPSSIVLRGQEIRLIHLPSVLAPSAEPASIHRIVRLRTGIDQHVAVAVSSIPGTRWRLENTVHPVETENSASYEEHIRTTLGLLRLVGPEFPPAVQNAHVGLTVQQNPHA